MTLFASIPSQKKASKPSVITFLCNLHIIICKIQRKSTHPSRYNLLSNFFTFMKRVECEARTLISTNLDSKRSTMLKSKRLLKEELKRGYLKDGGKSHPHFTQCPMCGHSFIDLPPSNDDLHDKYMRQLREYQRVVNAFEKHEEDSGNPVPKDADGKIVKTLPRKPQGRQPLLRCHCVQMQWSCNKQLNTCPVDCGGRADCAICKCSCLFA